MLRRKSRPANSIPSRDSIAAFVRTAICVLLPRSESILSKRARERPDQERSSLKTLVPRRFSRSLREANPTHKRQSDSGIRAKAEVLDFRRYAAGRWWDPARAREEEKIGRKKLWGTLCASPVGFTFTA